jgi:hypothetical protein
MTEQYSGNLIDSLEQTVIRVEQQSYQVDPGLFLGSAKSHLNDQLLTKDIADAWDILDIAQLSFLQRKTPCSSEFGYGPEVRQCQNYATTFCGGCGREICSKCARKCCMETWCSECLEQHVKIHGPIEY